MKRSSSSLEDWLPKVRTMALAYTIPFYMTWLVPLCWNIIIVLIETDAIALEPTETTTFIMQVYVAISMPLQGFINAIIYMNPFGIITGTFLHRLCNKGSRGERGTNPANTNGVEHPLQQQHNMHPVVQPRMAEPSSSKKSSSNPPSDGFIMGENNPSHDVEPVEVATVSTDASIDSIRERDGTPAAANATDHDIEAGNDVTPRIESQNTDNDDDDRNTDQPTGVMARQALENSLDLVRESISSGLSSIESSSSEGEDAASLESQTLRVLDIINEALELTRSFVEEDFENLTDQSPPERQEPTPNIIPVVSNYASATRNVGCQAPPPIFPAQMPLPFALPGGLPSMPSVPSTRSERRDNILQIIEDALEIVGSDVESITNGSYGSDVRSVLSGSRELEAMLEGTLDALNTFLPPAQQSSSHRPQQQQHALGTAPTSNTVPSSLENVRRTEVSMLSSTISSTIVEDDQNNDQDEEKSNDDEE